MLKQYMDYLKIRLGGDEAATAVEYGIMVALVAVAIIIAVTALGEGLVDTFNEVTEELP